MHPWIKPVKEEFNKWTAKRGIERTPASSSSLPHLWVKLPTTERKKLSPAQKSATEMNSKSLRAKKCLPYLRRARDVTMIPNEPTTDKPDDAPVRDCMMGSFCDIIIPILRSGSLGVCGALGGSL